MVCLQGSSDGCDGLSATFPIECCEIFDEKKTDGRILGAPLENDKKKCFIQILCQVEQDVEIVYGNDGFFLILNSLLSVLK